MHVQLVTVLLCVLRRKMPKLVSNQLAEVFILWVSAEVIHDDSSHHR